MTPQSPSRRVHAPLNFVRRAGMFVVAAVLVGGVPLVAQALTDDPDAATALAPPATSVQVARAPVTPVAPPTTLPEAPEAPEAEPVVEEVSQPETVLLAELPPGPAAVEWAALRECESGGDYTITNPSGKYRGAYQFDRSTWNSVAERHAPALIGVDPAAASPADQDAMAYALYTERGARPWPHCGRHLS